MMTKIPEHINRYLRMYKIHKMMQLPLKLMLLVAFLMIFWRANNLSIAHDEALTVNNFVSRSYGAILGREGAVDILYANNHPLNTALIKFFTSFLGTSELVVRLPALIGAFLYLFSAYYIVHLLFNKRWQKFISLSFLVFQPFLIDYFSAARGYALSLGLLMLGIYLMEKSVKINSYTNIIWSFLGIFAASLAVSNNLNFMHAFVSMVMCYFYISCRKIKPLKIVSFMLGVLCSLMPIYFIYSRNFFNAYSSGLFHVGGKDGFWRDTLPSLLHMFLYTYEANISFQILRIIFLIIVLVGTCMILYSKKSIPIFFATLLIGTVVSVYSLAKFFHVDVVVERGAIYFLPLISIFLLSVWSSLDSVVKNNIYSKIFAGCIVIITLYTASRIQFTHYYTWPYDQYTKQVFDEIISDYKRLGMSDHVSIRATWLFEPSLTFYRKKYHVNFLNPILREPGNEPYMYYYIMDGVDHFGIVENAHDLKNANNLRVMKYFDDINATLLTK